MSLTKVIAWPGSPLLGSSAVCGGGRGFTRFTTTVQVLSTDAELVVLAKRQVIYCDVTESEGNKKSMKFRKKLFKHHMRKTMYVCS